MQRRDIKRGARDARDRARHRGGFRHLDDGSDDDRLHSHLNGLEHPVDIDAFARNTAHLDISLGERLRQLAIHLERDGGCDVQVLERIYESAIDAEPSNPHLWSSRALSYWYEHPETPDVLSKVVSWSRRAVELAPNEGHGHSVLGQMLYMANSPEAEPVLRRSIALGHRGWPHLWLAHALHDSERWEEAAEAYGAVPAECFSGAIAWRVQLARQQRAACLLRAGRRADAEVVYSDVIDRFERALDAGMNASNSPVLTTAPPTYLYEDAPDLPGLTGRISTLRSRLDGHEDVLLHSHT